MHSRCIRRRPSHLSPANCTQLNVGFPVLLEPTSAHARQSRRDADSTHCAGDNGAHAERRLLVRGQCDGRHCLRLVQPARLETRASPRQQAPLGAPSGGEPGWSALACACVRGRLSSDSREVGPRTRPHRSPEWRGWGALACACVRRRLSSDSPRGRLRDQRPPTTRALREGEGGGESADAQQRRDAPVSREGSPTQLVEPHHDDPLHGPTPSRAQGSLIEKRVQRIANARSVTLGLAVTFVGLALVGAIVMRFADSDNFPSVGLATWWALQT